MGDRVTSISLLTAAMEINNVIGHALDETPSRRIESPLLPPCDGMKTLKTGCMNKIMKLYEATLTLS